MEAEMNLRAWYNSRALHESGADCFYEEEAMELNNGKCGYEVIEHRGVFKLFRFDLTINDGRKLHVGTVAVIYPTREAAVAAGERWMEAHSISNESQIKRMICCTLRY
jgi:hypothetical protein